MSNPLKPNVAQTATEQFTQQFGNFDNTQDQAYAPVLNAPASFDGVGFWYRPEPQEVYFHHHSADVGQPSTNISEANVPVKHRRTRSGCFTCRSRRVKCDETRPTCDRCRKGNRECVFPQASSASKRLKDDSSGERGSLSPQDTRRASGPLLDPIQDLSEEEDLAASIHSPTSRSSTSIVRLSRKSRKHRHKQQASESQKGKSPTPSETASHSSREIISPERLIGATSSKLSPQWSHLKADEQDLLQFQHDCMTSHHYFLRLDHDDFVHDTLISLALEFEPLLNAVLAFVAYHQQIRSQAGQFKEFWKYYCRSIVQLRKWLEDKGERNESVVLTIIQLSMFEEYLGDWVNLVSHHRAANSIILSLYTKDTIMQTETSRTIFDWFTRVDICASFMANIPTTINREWFISALTWYQARYDPETREVEKALEYFHATLRLIGFDMACSYAGASQANDFAGEAATIAARLDSIRLEIQTLHGSAESSDELSHWKSQEHEDSREAFDTHTPLFTNDLWPLNYIWLDWYGAQQMHLYQTARLLQRQALMNGLTLSQSELNVAEDLPQRLNQFALAQCQIYEAVERWSSAPAGATLACHITMAFSTIFLGRELKFTMWARRKLANIERMGYVWPAKFREAMANLWCDEEIIHWWLPKGDGKPALLNEVRAVVDDRIRDNALHGIIDDGKEDLRELAAIFDKTALGMTASLNDSQMLNSATSDDSIESETTTNPAVDV